MSTVDELANDIRTVDGENKLGAGELAEKLFELNWRKQSVLEAELTAIIHPPLKSYQDGVKVEVFLAEFGGWTPAFVTSVSDYGTISVHTDRGPRSIASASNIRLAQVEA